MNKFLIITKQYEICYQCQVTILERKTLIHENNNLKNVNN